MDNINLDDLVKIKLNEKGIELLNNNKEYKEIIKVNENNYITTTMLDFMNMFYDYIKNNKDLPYEGNIKILGSKENIQSKKFESVNKFLNTIDNIYNKAQNGELKNVKYKKKISNNKMNNGIVIGEDFIIEKDDETKDKNYYYLKIIDNNSTINKDKENNRTMILSNGKILANIENSKLLYCDNEFLEFINETTEYLINTVLYDNINKDYKIK